MIQGDDVKLHLFDSGLLTIPFEYCVTRDRSKEIFIDDIPEVKEEIMVEKMDEIKIAKVESPALLEILIYHVILMARIVHMFSMKLIKPLNYLISLKKRFLM